MRKLNYWKFMHCERQPSGNKGAWNMPGDHYGFL